MKIIIDIELLAKFQTTKTFDEFRYSCDKSGRQSYRDLNNMLNLDLIIGETRKERTTKYSLSEFGSLVLAKYRRYPR